MDLRDYIEHLKSKPEHVRRRIALGTSAGVTALVFVGWLATVTSSGVLSLNTPSSGTGDAGASELAEAALQTGSDFSALLGAANAFQAAAANGQGVTVVGGKASSTLDAPSADENATVIPF